MSRVHSHIHVYIAADHAGFALKQALTPFLEQLGFVVIDCGAYRLDPTDDYPDYVRKAASAVSDNPQKHFGIVIGGSGQGEAMVANKFPHVRATVYYGGDTEIISLSREHNDANVLSLGARFLTTQQAKKVVRSWLLNQYSLGERHKQRIHKIEYIEYESAVRTMVGAKSTIKNTFKNIVRPLTYLWNQIRSLE